MSSAGLEAIELGESAGVVLDPWQKADLTDALGERADGKWAASEVGLVVPRQDGKGEILLVRELAGLYLFGEGLILHSAHLFKTSQEHFRRVLAVIEGCHDLDREVLKVRTAHGAEGIELKNGNRLNFMARSGGGGRGLGGDLLVLDEAFRLFAEMMAALYPTMSARPNPQIWYSSSAPLDGEESAVLRQVCRRGRRKLSKRLCYLEHCADPGDDPADMATVAKANPALGNRISTEFVEQEREALSPEDFARERCGIWNDAEHEDGGWEVFSRFDWEGCADQASTIVGPVTLAFDTGVRGDCGSVVAAGARSDGAVHVEVVKSGPGTDWLLEDVPALAKRHGAVVWAVKRSPAGAVCDRLAASGFEVQDLASADVPAACQSILTAVKDRQARHLGESSAQAPLTAAVRGAVPRTVGDAFVLSRKNSAVDISPLYAALAAMWGHRHPPGPAKSIYESRTLLVLG